jgi:hypothetical protein
MHIYAEPLEKDGPHHKELAYLELAAEGNCIVCAALLEGLKKECVRISVDHEQKKRYPAPLQYQYYMYDKRFPGILIIESNNKGLWP